MTAAPREAGPLGRGGPSLRGPAVGAEGSPPVEAPLLAGAGWVSGVAGARITASEPFGLQGMLRVKGTGAAPGEDGHGCAGGIISGRGGQAWELPRSAVTTSETSTLSSRARPSSWVAAPGEVLLDDLTAWKTTACRPV